MDQDQGKDSNASGGGPGGVAGPDGDPDEPLDRAFSRVRAAVDDGRTDLGRLGFWRLLGRIKRDPALSDRWAEAAGAIDRVAFERAVHLRVPVWVGNTVLLLGTAVGALGVVVALRAPDRPVAGLGLIAAAGIWSVSVHGLAHWAVGRAVGIRFTSYFFRPRQFPPRPGIKTDYATYLRADPTGRASMHAAGAVATKVAPFVALAFYPAGHAPAWAAWIVLGIGVGQIVTDLLFSTKSGDWSKVRREREIARRVAEMGRSVGDG